MTQLTRTSGNLFPDLFDLSRDWLDWSTNNYSSSGTSIPAVNIRETGDSFEVEMAAPGMSKKDFKIELDNNLLSIYSEKQQEVDKKVGERYTRKEFSYHSFQRSFTLPRGVVDADKINASYEDGVLHITIPKKEEAKPKPRKQISIK